MLGLEQKRVKAQEIRIRGKIVFSHLLLFVSFISDKD
jgi:hypothetical protein